MIWSIDPGDKRIGWAAWRENGELVNKGIWTPEACLTVLSEPDIIDSSVSKLVIEDWLMTPGKTKGGSSMGASRVIGWFELKASQLGVELVRQAPGILRLTALHAGVTLPAGHIPDDMSAYLHGFYYFESIDVLRPISMEDRT